MTTKARSTPCAHHPPPPSRMRLFVSGATGVLGRARGHGRPRARDVPEGRQDPLLDLLAGAVLGGALLRCRDVARGSVTSPCDQIAKANSSIATGSRR
jgi:hypothetical protein